MVFGPRETSSFLVETGEDLFQQFVGLLLGGEQFAFDLEPLLGQLAVLLEDGAERAGAVLEAADKGAEKQQGGDGHGHDDDATDKRADELGEVFGIIHGDGWSVLRPGYGFGVIFSGWDGMST